MGKKIQSLFYYGFEVDKEKNCIDVEVNGVQYTLNIPLGDWCPSELAELMTKLINFKSEDQYEFLITFDRFNCRYTFSANTDFSLLFVTGNNVAKSGASFLGFDDSFDHTGASTYISENVSGKKLFTQFPLQNLTTCAANTIKSNATVNRSEGNIFEVVSCGEESFLEFNMTLITNNTDQETCRFINPNPEGVDNVIEFLNWAICKKKVEFMRDCSKKDEYVQLVLESTPKNSKGVGYELKEMTSKGLCGYFETGKIKWRCIGGDKEEL